MSKELPWFKFHCDQWLGKKITLESFEIQGIFINVCAIYWANDCKIKIATLQKRYGEAIQNLVDEGYLKDKNGIAKISFLDSQWQDRYKTHKENSNNGKLGAKARWAKHREANGEANGEAIKKPIAIRKDKIKEDKIKIDFLVFWNIYPNKIGRAKCEPKWKSLDLETQDKIIETLPKFISHKPFETYNHPNPETYLNQKRWEDVIPEAKTEIKKYDATDPNQFHN
jgi:hypothetical protein